jgi:YHS domain-containing protein
MTDIRNTVTSYLHAVYSSDTSTARRFLAEQFSFIGPAARISDPDRFLSATEHAARAVSRVEMHKIFVDDQDACIFYDLQLNHAVNVVSVAEWYHLEGDRISAIRTILDTAPFTSTRSTGTETAVDPVCGMTVEKSSASATRSHRELVYYFCSDACAETFDALPDQFLQVA